MAKPTVSLATSDSDWVAPILDGRVETDGFEVVATVGAPSEIFWRQTHYHSFDVAEMAMPLLILAREQGDAMVAIPAFPSRRFVHIELRTHLDAGIDGPSAVNGKRWGVVEYCQASSVWTRGILEHDFGVDHRSVEWFVERSDEMSGGGAAGFRPPEGLRVVQMPPGETMRSLLLRDAVDVAPAAAPRAPTVIEAGRMRGIGEGDWSKIVPLFADQKAEIKRYFGAHGYIPPNHCYALRADVHATYPGLAGALYEAMVRAKAIVDAEHAAGMPSGLVFGDDYLDQAKAEFGEDPYAYGLAANAAMLGDIFTFSHEQGLAGRTYTPEEIFAPDCLDT